MQGEAEDGLQEGRGRERKRKTQVPISVLRWLALTVGQSRRWRKKSREVTKRATWRDNGLGRETLGKASYRLALDFCGCLPLGGHPIRFTLLKNTEPQDSETMAMTTNNHALCLSV